MGEGYACICACLHACVCRVGSSQGRGYRATEGSDRMRGWKEKDVEKKLYRFEAKGEREKLVFI